MDSQLSDTDRQILDIWEGMKPHEATALKFIVMDESGTFAGQFTCDIDSHGDRYFFIKQAPKSGKWTLSSNLVSNLETADKSLSKTAIKSREQYQASISKSVYRLDVDSTQKDNLRSSQCANQKQVITMPSSTDPIRLDHSLLQFGNSGGTNIEKLPTELFGLPKFDYSLREGVRPNTEEWGKANIVICANFATEALLYVINRQAQIYNNGKGNRSVSKELAWGAVLVLASELDQEMAECLKIVESSIKDLCFNRIVEDHLCRKLTNGELELVGEVQEEDNSREDDYEECEIEGLSFPLMTEFSPEKIHHYAFNRNEWISHYPSAADNWQKLATHSKLLNENRVIGSTSNNSLWLYTINQKMAGLDQKDCPEHISDARMSETNQSLGNSNQDTLPLTGQALIQKVKLLGDASPQQLANACGYKTKTNGIEYVDIESYYKALFEAYTK